MRINFYRDWERILAADMHNLLNRRRNAVNRHNNVVCQRYLADEADGFLTVAAHRPDAVVCLQNIDCTGSLAQLVELLHLHIQLILAEGFHRDDNINAVLIVRRTLKLNIISAGTHIGVVHIFHARRIQSGLHNLRHHVESLERIVEHSQKVKAIRRHRLQLQGYLGDNAQRTLAAHH